MAGGSIEIFVPRWHPAKLNQLMGGHWSKSHRLKRLDRQIVWGYSRGLPPATGRRRVELTIILKPKERGGDPDSYFKSLGDALVQAGMLVDDNRQGVEWAPIRYERGDHENWGTQISLVPLAGS